MLTGDPAIQKAGYFGFSADVLRLDLLHNTYGGNKIFKLRYNFLKAKELGCQAVVTFGGIHSNHIYSFAAYAAEQGMAGIAVIRGEESGLKLSPTLQFAIEKGIKLHFVSRSEYRNKTDESFINELQDKYGKIYVVPEGGNNEKGIRGCTEILNDSTSVYDYIFCACGTGCTFTGILLSAEEHQKVIGVSVLKGEDTLTPLVNDRLKKSDKNFTKLCSVDSGIPSGSGIVTQYHFGGYAKFSSELLKFKDEFERQNDIPLDYVYTSKLFYAVFDLLKTKCLPCETKILIIHSGGLQGNTAFERRYGLTG